MYRIIEFSRNPLEVIDTYQVPSPTNMKDIDGTLVRNYPQDAELTPRGNHWYTEEYTQGMWLNWDRTRA